MLSFKVDTSSGTLTPTSTMPWSATNSSIAVDPASKFLYASNPNSSDNSILIYAIDPATGALTSAGSSVLNSGGICGFGCSPPSGPGALTVAPNGKFLFYGSSTLGGVTQGVGALSVNMISGELNPVSGSPFTQSAMPFRVAVHPTNRFVYTENMSNTAPGFALQNISGFSVDPASGVLTAVPGSPFVPPQAGSVVGFSIHPSGNFLYAASGLAANGILAWSIDPNSGALSPLPDSPFASGSKLFGGTFDSAGQFFYVSAGTSGGIDGFSVDSNTGALSLLPGSPFSSSSVFAEPVVEPSGHFLFASSHTSQGDEIVEFSRDTTTGMLTLQGSPTVTSGLAATLTFVKAH
jgi:6-phosphogluconolactonase (cycloisomerase 2 family)